MTLVPEPPDDETQSPNDDPPGADSPTEAEAFGFDLGGLLAQAQSMQQQLMDAQAAAAAVVVEGQSGGGAVKIRVTGGLEFESVEIDRGAVDPDDVEMLQDLVLAAIRDAVGKANELNQEALGGLAGLAGGLGGVLGGGGGGLPS